MAQWMIKEETADRLILEKESSWWRHGSGKKIQIDVDVSSDIVSIITNQEGTTRLSSAGIENIELYGDRYDWIVYIKRIEGTLFHPPKELPEGISKLHIFICKDSDRSMMSEIAETLARFLKKTVSVT